MYLGTDGNKRFGARIRASKTEDLMARINQLSNDSRTYDACGPCNENTHILFLLIVSDSADKNRSNSIRESGCNPGRDQLPFANRGRQTIDRFQLVQPVFC